MSQMGITFGLPNHTSKSGFCVNVCRLSNSKQGFSLKKEEYIEFTAPRDTTYAAAQAPF